MNPEDAIDLGREAINTVMTVGGPILFVGVLIGLVIGMLQAMTQVQDQTVSFVPKILVMLLCIGLALPWLSEQMIEFTRSSIQRPVVGFPVAAPKTEQTGEMNAAPEYSAVNQTANQSSGFQFPDEIRR